MKKTSVFLALLLLLAPVAAEAYIETPTGVDVLVTYTEPTTIVGGQPITNLQSTTIYWWLGAGPETAVVVPAALGTGGAAISRTLSIPLGQCSAGVVSAQTTGTNPFGESARTPTVSLAVARVQGCVPASPSGLTVN